MGGRSEGAGCSWKQDSDIVTVTIKLPEAVVKAKLKIKFTSKSISVTYDGSSIMEGKLHAAILSDESTWYIDPVDRDKVQVQLEKQVHSLWPSDWPEKSGLTGFGPPSTPEDIFSAAVGKEYGTNGHQINLPMAWQLYEEAATKGHVKAICRVAAALAVGPQGCPFPFVQVDLERSFKLYELAAAQGATEAHTQLGRGYMNGVWPGREKSYLAAKKHFERAAENMSHPEGPAAMFNLGVMYEAGGFGVEQNYSKAVEWWERASMMKYAAAMYNLGVMYVQGTGVDANLGKAGEYFDQAVRIDPSFQSRVETYAPIFSQATQPAEKASPPPPAVPTSNSAAPAPAPEQKNPPVVIATANKSIKPPSKSILDQVIHGKEQEKQDVTPVAIAANANAGMSKAWWGVGLLVSAGLAAYLAYSAKSAPSPKHTQK